MDKKDQESDFESLEIAKGKEEQQRSGFDPLEIAKAEGKIYGARLSGRYKKNLITRIGFLYFAILFIITGILSILTAIFIKADFVLRVVYFLGGIPVSLGGFIIFKNVFKKT